MSAIRYSDGVAAWPGAPRDAEKRKALLRDLVQAEISNGRTPAEARRHVADATFLDVDPIAFRDVAAKRDDLIRAGFTPDDARRLASIMLVPSSPMEQAAAEIEVRNGPKPLPEWPYVVRCEAWSNAHELLALWLPVEVSSKRAGVEQRRRREEWGEQWTIAIDLISGDGFGVWHEETTGARGSDLISLFAWLANVKYGAALYDLARVLGIGTHDRRNEAARAAAP